MNTNQAGGGWYFRQGAERQGPLTPGDLKTLVTSGRLPARKAVWTEGERGPVIVPAATVAFGVEVVPLS